MHYIFAGEFVLQSEQWDSCEALNPDMLTRWRTSPLGNTRAAHFHQQWSKLHRRGWPPQRYDTHMRIPWRQKSFRKLHFLNQKKANDNYEKRYYGWHGNSCGGRTSGEGWSEADRLERAQVSVSLIRWQASKWGGGRGNVKRGPSAWVRCMLMQAVGLMWQRSIPNVRTRFILLSNGPRCSKLGHMPGSHVVDCFISWALNLNWWQVYERMKVNMQYWFKKKQVMGEKSKFVNHDQKHKC